MADDAANASAVAPETPVVEAPQTQPAETGTVAEAVPASEGQPETPAVDNAESEKLKFAENYHRQQLGKLGNSVAKVRPESRDRLAKNPTLIEEQEAEIQALRRIAASGGQAVGPQNGTQKPPTQIDDAESDAKEFLASEGWDGTEETYKGMLKHHTSLFKAVAKNIAKRQPSFDPEKATDAVAGRLTEREINSQLEEVYASPEWNDETKGAAYEGTFRRLAKKALEDGKRLNPDKIAAEARKIVYPAATKSPPKPKPSFGDQSSGKVSASADADPLDEFNKGLRAKGVDPGNW